MNSLCGGKLSFFEFFDVKEPTMRVRKQAVRHALPAFTSSAEPALCPNIGRKTKINRCLR